MKKFNYQPRLNMLALATAFSMQLLPATHASYKFDFSEANIEEIDHIFQQAAATQDTLNTYEDKGSSAPTSQLSTIKGKKDELFKQLEADYPVDNEGGLVEPISETQMKGYMSLVVPYRRCTAQYAALVEQNKYTEQKAKEAAKNLSFFSSCSLALNALYRLSTTMIVEDDLYPQNPLNPVMMHWHAPVQPEPLLHYAATLKKGHVELNIVKLNAFFSPQADMLSINAKLDSCFGDSKPNPTTITNINSWLVEFGEQYRYWTNKYDQASNKWEEINESYYEVTNFLSKPIRDNTIITLTPLGENFNSLGLLTIKRALQELKPIEDSETAQLYANINYIQKSKAAREEVESLEHIKSAFNKIKTFLDDIMEALRKNGKVS